MKELLVFLIANISFVFNTQYCQDNPGINGYYTLVRQDGIERQIIGFCNTQQFREEKTRVIIHELGHLFWYQYLTKEEQAGFIKIHEQNEKKSGTLAKRGFVTSYASSNYDEDFAESFAYSYIGGKNNFETVKYIKELINKKAIELNLIK